MLKLPTRPKKKKIDDEIEHCLVEMAKLPPNSQAYSKAAENLHRLCEAKKNKSEHHIDWNTVILAGVSIIEVLVVIFRENLGHVISSKAVGFIIKGGRI